MFKKLNAHFFQKCIDLYLEKRSTQIELEKTQKILKNLYQALDPGYSAILSEKSTENNLIYRQSFWLIGQRFSIDEENIGQKRLLAALEKAYDHLYGEVK